MSASSENRQTLVSLCIPAHNEAVALPGTLASWLVAAARPEFQNSFRFEILLGANACSDATEDLFRAALAGGEAGTYRVVPSPRPSKVVAWNSLVQAARGEFLVFSDADIIVPAATLFLLVTALVRHPAAQAAGGVLYAPERRHASALYRRLAIKMKEFATKPVPYLNGPLYALRRGAVTEIPEDVINEDTYLNIWVGADRIIKVPEAWGWQAPPSRFDEYYNREVRMRAGSLQLAGYDGDRYRAFRRATADPRSRGERQAILTVAERRTKLLLFWAGWYQRLLDRRARRAAAEIAATARWAACPWGPAASSKMAGEDQR